MARDSLVPGWHVDFQEESHPCKLLNPSTISVFMEYQRYVTHQVFDMVFPVIFEFLDKVT